MLQPNGALQMLEVNTCSYMVAEEAVNVSLILSPYKVDMASMLAKCCLFTQPTDTEQH